MLDLLSKIRMRTLTDTAALLTTLSNPRQHLKEELITFAL